MRRVIAFSMFLAAALIAVDAHAEVMDKEPSRLHIWLCTIVGGGLGLVAWRFRWWRGVAVTTYGALFFFNLHSELHDPFVGPDIRAEAGMAYIRAAVVGPWVFGGLQVAGVGLWLTRRSAGRRLTAR